MAMGVVMVEHTYIGNGKGDVGGQSAVLVIVEAARDT